MTRNTSTAAILNDIDKATFSDYEPAHAQRMTTARAVLLALPQETQEHYARMIGDLMCNISGRGFGPVTAFEVLVALAHWLEESQPR